MALFGAIVGDKDMRDIGASPVALSHMWWCGVTHGGCGGGLTVIVVGDIVRWDKRLEGR